MIKQNADIIAAGIGVGLLAGGVGLLWAWPAALVILGLGLIAAGAFVI